MLWVTNSMIDKTSDNNLHNIAIKHFCTCALTQLCKWGRKESFVGVEEHKGTLGTICPVCKMCNT